MPATPTPTLPLLRWAGGKRWLTAPLNSCLESLEPHRYFEPFLGGASIFLGAGYQSKGILSDSNQELITFYKEIQRAPEEVFAIASSLENTKETYYRVRATRPESTLERAAYFLYLNHTSFNGIYRVNLNGEYNVPYGFRKFWRLPPLEQINAASLLLKSAELSACDFAQTTRRLRSGDFIFIDPPYTVAHNNNGFVKYNQKLFSFADQARLARIVGNLDQRGVSYVITNAAHQSVIDLYKGIGTTHLVSRKNSIGGQGAKRGRAQELLITNLNGDWLNDISIR